MTETIVTRSDLLQSYEQILLRSSGLKGFPFEHTARNISHDQFVRRLLQERGLFAGGNLTPALPVNLVILADRDLIKFRRTLDSCFLQSARDYTVTVVSHDPAILKEARPACEERIASDRSLQSDFGERVFYRESIYEAARESDGYLIILRSGDVLHLSCVTSVYLELNREPVDICLWNEMEVDFGAAARVRKLLRKPLLERYTLFHFNYIGESFAIRAKIVSSFSEIDRWFSNGDLHYFLLTLVRNRHYQFATIPQFLLLRDVENVRSELTGPRLSAYRDYFADQGFAIKSGLNRTRYSLSPKIRAKNISVIIPFRNQPELTSKAVQSVLDQNGAEDLEIILIDNQSDVRTREALSDFLKWIQNVENMSIKLLRYDKPFNHSAQSNLGARDARGDCLVFMNNDAQLLSRNALSEMAAWSLLPDVGTVGVCMLHDMEGKKCSAGICARRIVGHEFNSPVEETEDLDWSNCNRETWGNSFACAAISRNTFESVGPLDEVNFPNGYNDVDYSMRCRKANLVNMYLGTVQVYHKPGMSRGRYDEIHQKLLLRRKYPEIFRDGLFQLASEKR